MKMNRTLALAISLTLLCSGVSRTAFAKDEIDLEAEVAALHEQMAAFSNLVKFVESRCETDAAWRKAYHQGVAAQAPVTNEFGIVYHVTVYNDGYTYADYKTTARKALTKAEEETRQKEILAKKRADAIAAMRKAQLPEWVDKRLAARQKAYGDEVEARKASSRATLTNDVKTVTENITVNSKCENIQYPISSIQ